MFSPVYMVVVSIIEWVLKMDPEFKEEYKLMYYIKEIFELEIKTYDNPVLKLLVVE